MTNNLFEFAHWALPAMPILTVMPLLLPALAAALILVTGRAVTLQRTIALTTLFALAVISGAMIIIADVHGIQTVQMGGWEAPIGITLVADRLSTIMVSTLR